MDSWCVHVTVNMKDMIKFNSFSFPIDDEILQRREYV